MSSTRGRLVSFAWEIQMSHHSIASRAGGAASGLAAAILLANPPARQRASIQFLVNNRQIRIERARITFSLLFMKLLFGIWLWWVRVLSGSGLDELRSFIERNPRHEPRDPGFSQVSSVPFR